MTTYEYDDLDRLTEACRSADCQAPTADILRFTLEVGCLGTWEGISTRKNGPSIRGRLSCSGEDSNGGGEAVPTRVIAVRDVQDAEPLDAVVLQTKKGRSRLIEWWGGYGRQTLSGSVLPEDVSRWPGWRPFALELPKDWEEGYLRVLSGSIEFVYGKPPPRASQRSPH